jgi:putative transposase
VIRDSDAVAIAVDETQIKIDGETKWLYAAIDVGSKLLLEVDVYSRRGTNPAAGFLYRLTEKHKVPTPSFSLTAWVT